MIFINKRDQIIDITALIWYNNNIEVSARGVMLLPQGLPFLLKLRLVIWFFGGNTVIAMNTFTVKS